MRKKKSFLPLLLIAILVAFVLLNRAQFGKNGRDNHRDPSESSASKRPSGSAERELFEEIAAKSSKIIYSKHARCRMGCRQIDESEIREVLGSGKINYQKSNPDSKPDPRYAIEGATHDGQEVRLIVAMDEQWLVIVTVIDLQKEWSCNCK